jgi:hypothetical protein
VRVGKEDQQRKGQNDKAKSGDSVEKG